jgi:hypothetical protein
MLPLVATSAKPFNVKRAGIIGMMRVQFVRFESATRALLRLLQFPVLHGKAYAVVGPALFNGK